jgi:hypothetical protein
MYKRFDDGALLHIPGEASVLFSYVPEGCDTARGAISGPARTIVPMLVGLMNRVFDELPPECRRTFLSDVGAAMADLALAVDGVNVVILKTKREEDDDE